MKTGKKDHSFYNKVLLEKSHSFCEPELIQHCKKCTPVSQPKTILITNFPANMFLVCIRNNICTAPYLSAQKLHSQTDLEIKYLYILVNLRKKTFVPESYLVVWEGGGLNNFL